MIGAVGRKKAEKPDSDPDVWCVKFLPGSNERLRQDEMGNVEVERIGTGFLKIDLAVFRRLAAAHPEWKLPGDDGMDPAVRAWGLMAGRFRIGIQSVSMSFAMSSSVSWFALYLSLTLPSLPIYPLPIYPLFQLLPPPPLSGLLFMSG